MPGVVATLRPRRLPPIQRHGIPSSTEVFRSSHAMQDYIGIPPLEPCVADMKFDSSTIRRPFSRSRLEDLPMVPREVVQATLHLMSLMGPSEVPCSPKSPSKRHRPQLQPLRMSSLAHERMLAIARARADAAEAERVAFEGRPPRVLNSLHRSDQVATAERHLAKLLRAGMRCRSAQSLLLALRRAADVEGDAEELLASLGLDADELDSRCSSSICGRPVRVLVDSPAPLSFSDEECGCSPRILSLDDSRLVSRNGSARSSASTLGQASHHVADLGVDDLHNVDEELASSEAQLLVSRALQPSRMSKGSTDIDAGFPAACWHDWPINLCADDLGVVEDLAGSEAQILLRNALRQSHGLRSVSGLDAQSAGVSSDSCFSLGLADSPISPGNGSTDLPLGHSTRRFCTELVCVQEEAANLQAGGLMREALQQIMLDPVFLPQSGSTRASGLGERARVVSSASRVGVAASDALSAAGVVPAEESIDRSLECGSSTGGMECRNPVGWEGAFGGDRQAIYDVDPTEEDAALTSAIAVEFTSSCCNLSSGCASSAGRTYTPVLDSQCASLVSSLAGSAMASLGSVSVQSEARLENLAEDCINVAVSLKDCSMQA